MWDVVRRGVVAVVVCAALAGAGEARAVSLSLLPASASLIAGSPVAIDVVITGLGAGAPPTLAAFDLDISFAPSVLSFVSVDFGLDLGVPGIDALTSSGLLAGPVRVDLASTSLLPDATLDANQPTDFVLATLHFLALAPGTSPLAITQAVLANTPGGSIAAALSGASVTVLPVPEPATLIFTAIGTALLALRRR